MLNAKKRIEWIDIAKGIAMILVIVGHCVWGNESSERVRGLIFSVHMPLFFALSAVTCRYAKSVEDFKGNIIRSTKHLLIPAMVIWAMYMVINCAYNPLKITDALYWNDALYTLIFASGVDILYGNRYIAMIGIPWFLFALFCGRTLFDYIQLSYSRQAAVIISCVLSALGVVFGKTLYLPFSLDVALATMPFFAFGKRIKDNGMSEKNIKIMMISFVIWICGQLFIHPISMERTYMELSARNYGFYPICFVVACSGVLFLSQLSSYFVGVKVISSLLKYIGKNSLYLLIVHSVDYNIYRALQVKDDQIVSSLIRIGLDLIMFASVMPFVESYRKAKQKRIEYKEVRQK